MNLDARQLGIVDGVLGQPQSEIKEFLTLIADKLKRGVALTKNEKFRLAQMVLLYEHKTDLKKDKQGTLVGLIADSLNEAAESDEAERTEQLNFVSRYLREIT